MMPSNRRYDIDWLRVIAIALLLIYHIGIGFQPWGVFIGFIQNDTSLGGLWVPMSMLNVWRIPLLFFVSGMGVSFAMRKRSIKALILERSRRILVPFLFGIIAIVPIHLIIWQSYYNQDITYSLSQSHLWFLGNIFLYVILLAPLMIYLQKNDDIKMIRALRYLYANPLGLLLITGAFVLEVIVIRPETYEAYSLTLHGYLIGLLSFFFGFTFVFTGIRFWNTVSKWKLLYFGFALSMFICRLVFFDLEAPGFYKAIESNMWIFAAFGFAHSYLNKHSVILSYLSKAAYQVYILHMIFIYLASYLIMPLDLSAELKLVLVILITFTGCFASYELIIRRIRRIRVLFGLK